MLNARVDLREVLGRLPQCGEISKDAAGVLLPRSARQGAGRVEDIAVKSDCPRHNALVESHLSGEIEAVADKCRPKHILHCGGNIVIVPDQRESRTHCPGIARVARLLLRGADLPIAEHVRRDLVEGNDRNALLELAVCNKRLARRLSVHNDIVELATGSDLERRGGGGIFHANEIGNKALDALAVKLGLGVRVCKVESTEARRERIDLFAQGCSLRLLLLESRRQLLHLGRVVCKCGNLRLQVLHGRLCRFELTLQLCAFPLASLRLLAALLGVCLEVSSAHVALLCGCLGGINLRLCLHECIRLCFEVSVLR
eukprot:Opistho-2@84093